MVELARSNQIPTCQPCFHTHDAVTTQRWSLSDGTLLPAFTAQLGLVVAVSLPGLKPPRHTGLVLHTLNAYPLPTVWLQGLSLWLDYFPLMSAVNVPSRQPCLLLRGLSDTHPLHS